MKILLVGGGSGGPVSPLLAVAEEIKKNDPKAQFLLIVTKNGPESLLAKNARVPFKFIVSGKLRRYFSFENFLSPFQIIIGFFQALKILKEFKPNAVFGSGSFVQVPIVWAAKFKSIPVVLHQQDVIPGLANKLCQFAAKKITVSFESSLRDFYSGLGIFDFKKHEEKTVLTGNPFREELLKGSHEAGLKFFNLRNDLPTLLVIGGGIGAEFLNNLIFESLPTLSKTVQIIHSTGKGKLKIPAADNYHPYEFISNMADAYAAADIVLARAGLSTITELSNLQKLSIIVPMPDTHQEANALYLLENRAAFVLSQKRINEEGQEGIIRLIRRLIFANDVQEHVKTNISKIMPKNSAKKIADIILNVAVK